MHENGLAVVDFLAQRANLDIKTSRRADEGHTLCSYFW